jgi:hypothetical protein
VLYPISGVPEPLGFFRDKRPSPDAIDLTQPNSSERVEPANPNVRTVSGMEGALPHGPSYHAHIRLYLLRPTQRAREGQLSGVLHVAGGCRLAALRSLQLLHRRIAAFPQCEIDPLQDDIMDFAALLEGGLA